MKKLVLYLHGKGGFAAESEHYKPLFPDCDVIGLNYHAAAPWETGEEIRLAVETLRERYGEIHVIANSIGAYFCLHAGISALIQSAWFLSPVVDLEALICSMMQQAGVTEADLQKKGVISTPFGETLSWEYLCYVRTHPVSWHVPTKILCGGKDTLVPFATVRAFAEKTGAEVTVMKSAAHWFHTPEELAFLDRWIKEPWIKTE